MIILFLVCVISLFTLKVNKLFSKQVTDSFSITYFNEQQGDTSTMLECLFCENNICIYKYHYLVKVTIE